MSILDNVEEYKEVEKMIKSAVVESSQTVTTALKEIKESMEKDYIKVIVCNKTHNAVDKRILIAGIAVSVALLFSGYAAGLKTIEMAKWIIHI